MKDSNVLNRPFLRCSLLAAVTVSSLGAGSLESYLSELQKDQLGYERDKIEAESNRLKRTPLEPINLRYGITKSNPVDVEQTSQNAAITIDQPIFRSGGIYYAIKYADATRQYGRDTLSVQERSLVKEAVSLLMQIRQSELRLQKQELLVANAKINVEQKSEQYRSGQLDSTFFDQAIIEQNGLIQGSYDLQTALQRLRSSFSVISDADPESLKLPKLELVDEQRFIDTNLELRQARSEAQKERYYKNTITAKYLPKVSFTAGYYWDKQEDLVFGGGSSGLPPFTYEQDYYSYGLSVTMPINFGALEDIEAARVGYLKSSLQVEQKAREQKALFAQVMQNIRNFEQKIALAESSVKLYEKLYRESQALSEAGYKTSYDVETLYNSMRIQRLESKIYALDRQLELLNLYEKSVDDL